MERKGLFCTLIFVFLPIWFFISYCFSANAVCAEDIDRWRRQIVYVPVYSHIYTGDKEMRFALAATLSIRNTDLIHSIHITAVEYYNSDGELLKRYLDNPLKLGPLASTRYVIQESDISGGSGAKFIVKWNSTVSVTQPIIEGIMIGTRSNQGISFPTRGQVISGEK